MIEHHQHRHDGVVRQPVAVAVEPHPALPLLAGLTEEGDQNLIDRMVEDRKGVFQLNLLQLDSGEPPRQ